MKAQMYREFSVKGLSWKAGLLEQDKSAEESNNEMRFIV